MNIQLKFKLSSYIKSLLVHLGTHLKKQLEFYGIEQEVVINVPSWHSFIGYHNARPVGDELLLASLNIDTEPINFIVNTPTYSDNFFGFKVVTAKSWLDTLIPNRFGFNAVQQSRLCILEVRDLDNKIASRVINNLSDVNFSFVLCYSDIAYDLGALGSNYVIRPSSEGMRFVKYEASTDALYRAVRKRNEGTIPESREIRMPAGFKEIFNAEEITEANTVDPGILKELLKMYDAMKEDANKENDEEGPGTVEEPGGAGGNTGEKPKGKNQKKDKENQEEHAISDSESGDDPDKNKKKDTNEK